MTTRRVYHEPETVPEGTTHGETETNPVSDREREPASSSQPPSEPAQTETTHTPVKRLRLQGKQSHVQSDGGRQTQTQNRESSVTTHVPSQPMDLSDMSARLRVNMKRSPLESQGDRSKQRRVMEDPDEDEVMIGEVQLNEGVEHPTSEVSGTEFDDWQQKEYQGILRELQSQNDFMSFHGVQSSEVANKEVIKTRWVLKPQGQGVKARFVMKHFNTWKDEHNDFYAVTPTPVSFNLVLALAAKRVALGKSQTIACLDISTAFLHAKMKDEVYIKLDDTLRMIHEENMTS